MLSYNKIFRKNHLFQLVEPSSIPVVISISVFLFVSNLVMLFHTASYFHTVLNQINVVLLIIVINWWFASMRVESNQLFIYTKDVESNILMGMLLFITSEIFLFVSVFWAFFNSSLCPSIFIGSVWPPIGIEAVSPWKIPFLNTMILLISGITVNSFYYSLKTLSFCPTSVFPKITQKQQDSSHHLISLSKTSSKNPVYFNLQKPFSEIKTNWIFVYRHLLVTILLGFFFLTIQVFEYIHSFFSISDGVYGSVFYMSTGLHGCHVFLGLVMLITCFIRTVLGDYDFNPKVHLSSTCTVWYWHFVDVVWLFLFIFVYIWGS